MLEKRILLISQSLMVEINSGLQRVPKQIGLPANNGKQALT